MINSIIIRGDKNDRYSNPCKNEVEKYLKKWDSLENYVLQEKSLDKLFFITYPNNNEIEDILIKVSSLNDFYSTNIFSVFPVAKHILNLGIDNRLKSNDETLVNDIANLSINGKKKCFYSFATKYCSHHNPINFQIYDSYVDKILNYYNNYIRLLKRRCKDTTFLGKNQIF